MINQKLAEAKILAARKMPYMTHQVMSLLPVGRPGLGTMAVDDYGRLYFDPAFLEGRDLKHLAFVVLHEAIHVWGRHAKRALRLLGEKPARDRLEIWRKAVDAAVNDVLEQSGLRCPEEGVTPAKLGLPRNKTPEEYFRLLLERAEQEAAQRQQQPQPGQGQGQQQKGQDQGEEKNEQPSEDQGQGQGEDGPEGESPAEAGGSAADGQPRPWEDGPPSAEHPGLAEHEQNIVEAAVAKAIEQYEQQRGRGSVPGCLAR